VSFYLSSSGRPMKTMYSGHWPPSFYKKVMIEIATQIFGMTFVGIILICMVWTIGSYILGSYKKQW